MDFSETCFKFVAVVGSPCEEFFRLLVENINCLFLPNCKKSEFLAIYMELFQSCLLKMLKLWMTTFIATDFLPN